MCLSLDANPKAWWMVHGAWCMVHHTQKKVVSKRVEVSSDEAMGNPVKTASHRRKSMSRTSMLYPKP
jgi:hypothetical protein